MDRMRRSRSKKDADDGAQPVTPPMKHPWRAVAGQEKKGKTMPKTATVAGTAVVQAPSRSLEGIDDKAARELFDRMDSNGNGGLSLAEIDKAIIELYPAHNHKPSLLRAYKAADRNGDGFVSGPAKSFCPCIVTSCVTVLLCVGRSHGENSRSCCTS